MNKLSPEGLKESEVHEVQQTKGEMITTSRGTKVELPEGVRKLDITVREHYTNENERAAMLAKLALAMAALLFCAVAGLAFIVMMPEPEPQSSWRELLP